MRPLWFDESERRSDPRVRRRSPRRRRTVPDGHVACTAAPSGTSADRFDAEAQAFVDAGYAVALVNYRGSTGYGIAFRQALIGNPWLPETEDVIAGLDRLIADGITDPDRVVLERLVVGRLPRVPQRRSAPRSMARGLRRDPGRATSSRRTGDCSRRCGRGTTALYGGKPRRAAGRYGGTQPDDVRRPRSRSRARDRGRERPRCPSEGITPWVDALANAGGVTVEVHLYPRRPPRERAPRSRSGTCS